MKNLFNEADHTVIFRRMNQLTDKHQAHWGKMNVTQMLCHCGDQLRVAMGFMEVKSNSNFFKRTVLKRMALWFSMPKGRIETVDELNQVKGNGTPSVTFRDDRVNLVKLMNLFLEQPDSFKWSPHPTFGELSKKEWGRLAYQHLDHHLRQFGV